MAEWDEIRALDIQGQGEKLLSALMATPAKGARDWYNRGTAALKQNQLGPARAYLEKALSENQMRPELPTPWIEKNLTVATSRLQEKIGTAATQEVRSWNEVLAEQPWFAPVESLVAIAALLAGILMLRRKRLLPWLAAPIFFFALALPAFTARRTARTYALVDTVLRSGPGSKFLEIGRVEAGCPLRYTGEHRSEGSEGWLQVRFENLALGLLPEASVLRMR